MEQTDKSRAALLAAVVTIVVVLAVSLVVHGPVWMWAAVVVVGAGGAALAAQHVVHRREQAELRRVMERQQAQIEQKAAEPEETEPPAHVQYPLSAIPLPSSEIDYKVLLSATVCWRQIASTNGPPHTSPVDLAVNWILTRARELTVLEKPEEFQVVQHRLGVSLGTPLAEPYGQVVAWAVDVSLTVSDEDARRLARLAELRKHERMWEQERRMEVSMRRYLSEDVLKDTGSAIVWWLARHPDAVEQTVQLIGPLAQITAAANSKDLPVPELLRAIQAAEANGRHIPPSDGTVAGQ
ncbi:hypothetical protein [Actinocrispum wychmicini]|uniref:Uncharacterized protein n=1 Tax=Actinocrispum wychmicini TaxID=1213861 RepID=A0A4R2IHD0_9PSEU|nr:hypothetical protein [Actinocrispum wychmicini]TCO44234.1 hypothetical protein EV192_1247 [Actinocrispum wychmicini]